MFLSFTEKNSSAIQPARATFCTLKGVLKMRSVRCVLVWTPFSGDLYCSRSGPSIVPVSCYSACEIAWHRWEPSVVALCGVMSFSFTVPIFPAGTMPALQLDHKLLYVAFSVSVKYLGGSI